MSRVHPGKFYLPGNANYIPTLEAVIQQQAERLHGWRGFQVLSFGSGWDAVAEHIRMATSFIGPGLRDLVNHSEADFVPNHLSELPLLFNGRWRPDVAFMHVSPPDEDGNVTLGLDAGISYLAYEAAKHEDRVMIAVVNQQMPRFHIAPTGEMWNGKPLMSGCSAHIDEFDAVIEIDEPLVTHDMGDVDDVSAQIGKHIARLIPNGATIQLGIGAIPNAVTAALTGHKGLGIHSELISDGVLELIRQGVVDGSRKTRMRGKHTIGFALGSRELYKALTHEDFAIVPQAYVNRPSVIAEQARMININSTLAIDLQGNVGASMVIKEDGSPLFYSGIGGARDFAQGANMSEGGRSIIALPSAYRDREGRLHSRIVPLLPMGTHVTTNGDTLEVVVTEHGIAELTGLTVLERARKLVELAHPQFRDELLSEIGGLPGYQRLKRVA